MQSTIRIAGQNLDIWNSRGFVDSVSSQSHTQVWGEGGGGYVDSKYGGYVQPPTIHSRIVHTKEVRVTSDDNSRETVKLPGETTFDTNDDVSLFYANKPGAKTGAFVGIANHTEGKYWSMPPTGLIKFVPSVPLKLFRFAAICCVALAILFASNEDTELDALNSSQLARSVREINVAQTAAWNNYIKTHRVISMQSFLNCCYQVNRAPVAEYEMRLAKANEAKKYWTDLFIQFLVWSLGLCLVWWLWSVRQRHKFTIMVRRRIGDEIQKMMGTGCRERFPSRPVQKREPALA